MDLNATAPTTITAGRPARTPGGAHVPQAARPSRRATGDPAEHSGRWRVKLTLLTWAGAYAVIMAVLIVGGPTLASWPLALRALALSGLMVAAMTWVIMPLMTRLFRPWLLR
jgi:antibiotic biosynthesis monooxygenase (ABM) superfamily enzyme